MSSVLSLALFVVCFPPVVTPPTLSRPAIIVEPIRTAAQTVQIPSVSERSTMLPALYVGYGTLQAFDLYTTSQALKVGAREKNPVLAPVARNLVVMSVIKAASTASVIYFTERVRKRNRTAAVVLMVALNGTVAVLAVRNARTARRQ